MTIMTATLEIKIMDLDCFKEYFEALEQWAEEVQSKADMSNAERTLFHAAVKLADEQ
jgi:hypothetical protein